MTESRQLFVAPYTAPPKSGAVPVMCWCSRAEILVRVPLNRLRHPTQETPEQTLIRPAQRQPPTFFVLTLGDAALVEKREEAHVVRLGNRKAVITYEHGVVVKERTHQRK